MKKIKMLFKTKNYVGSEIGNTLKSSLAHSFRVVGQSVSAKEEALKWDEKLVTANRVYFGESFLSKLDLPTGSIEDFSAITLNGKNAEIVNAIVRHYAKPGDANERNRKLASAKNSLKKACLVVSPETRYDVSVSLGKYFNGDITPQRFKEILLALPSTCNAARLITQLERFEAARRQINFPSQKSTIVQEGILTFPLKDPISEGFSKLSGELSVDDLINSIKKLLHNYFDDFPIIAIIGHVDEVRMHVHYFIDGWCNGRQKETIPQKVSKMFLDKDMQQSNSTKQLSQSKLVNIGENFQRSIYGFINFDLLQERGLEAKISPEHERKSEAAKHRNADARKPINMRHYQRINELIREKERELETLEQEIELKNKQKAYQDYQMAGMAEKQKELALLIREQDEIVAYYTGEKLQDFIRQLRDAFKLAPQLTFTTDVNQLIVILTEKYPLLKRDFWQAMLTIGLTGHSANRWLQAKNSTP